MLAIEAIVFEKANVWRLPVIFAFGLFHGLGFGEIMKAYLTNADFATGLAGFTLGVELGQLTVIAGAASWPSPSGSASKPPTARTSTGRVFVQPVAGVIALVGLYWVVERLGWLGGE